MKKKIVSSVLVLASALSMFAFAGIAMASAVDTSVPPGYSLSGGGSSASTDSVIQARLLSITGTINSIVRSAIPIVFSLAIVYFFWGLAQYILNSGDTEGREEGKNRMIYGVLAIFVMVSVFGLISLISNTLGLQQLGGTTPVYNITIPTIKVN